MGETQKEQLWIANPLIVVSAKNIKQKFSNAVGLTVHSRIEIWIPSVYVDLNVEMEEVWFYVFGKTQLKIWFQDPNQRF